MCSARTRPKWRWWGLFVAWGLALALASINLGVGRAGDLDGQFIYQRALAWGQEGLAPSRSWGQPAYEALVYPLVYYLGPLAGQLYSLALLLGALALFHRLAGRVAGDWRSATWATLALTVTPVVVISGNSLLETSQGLLLGIAALYVYALCLERPSSRRLALLGALLGLATATRPDYALLAGALVLVLLWRGALSWRGALLGVACYVLCGLAPYALYWRTIGQATVVLADPLGQRILRAGVGLMQFLGPAAWGVLAAALFWRRPAAPSRARGDVWLVTLLLATALYAVRFVMLPDELEYLLPLWPLVLLVLLQRGWRERWLLALMLALALPNFVQPHLLAARADGARYLSPGLSPGAVWQDRAARLRWEYVYDALPAQFDALAAQEGAARYSLLPSEEPGALVIIPLDQTRFYAPERHGGRFARVGCSQTIYVYPMPSDRGWRQLTRYQPWEPVGADDFRRWRPSGCEED